MRVLITGITGFSGQYLLHYLKKQEISSLSLFGLVHTTILERTNFYIPLKGDLRDVPQIREMIKTIVPDVIIHLAGRNQGSLCEMLDSNVICTENLMQAVLLTGINPRILMIGSAAEYGYQGEGPIPENTPVHPVSMYGITKAAQTSLSCLYYARNRLNICIVRPFNLIGPGQLPLYVCGNIVHQMYQRKKGQIKSVHLNGSNSMRDFIDIRDAVRAYWSLVNITDDNHFFGQIYNVGSGTAYSIREIVSFLEEMTRIDSNLLFSGEGSDLIPIQICNYSKIHEITGWIPEISIKSSLLDMFHWEMKNEGYL